MKEIEIKFATRYIKRKQSNAIGKSLLKTLTEPITNSDDSYRRIAASEPERTSFPVDIYINRKTRVVRITDQAEGMSREQLESKFEYYGSDKSGASQGKDVRGLFGQGISDTLLYHSEGVIKTIKEGKASLCYFYEKNGRPFIKIEEAKLPLDKLEREWFIKDGHGTTVEFKLDEGTAIHEYENLIDKLGSFYMLRFINSDDNRDINLTYVDSRGERKAAIKYVFPKGELVKEEELSMEFERRSPVKVEAAIYRSNEPLITLGEGQQNGLLIYDDKNTVYDLTFFGLESLPSTDRFFGFVKLTGAREVILEKINHHKHPEEVLTDSRDGFNRQHEFYKELEQIMRDWLYPVLNDERRRRSGENVSEKVKERYQKALSELNKLYAELAGDDSSGTITTKKPSRPAGGMIFARNNIQITSGKKYGLQLIVDTRVIKPDSVIRIGTTKGKVAISPVEMTVTEPEREDGLLIKSVSVRGNEIDSADTIIASFGRRNASCVVSVVKEEIIYPENGLAFYPDYISALKDRDTVLSLYVDLKLIPKHSKIKIISSNNSIEVKESIVIPKPNLRTNKKIARVPVIFRGKSVGESGTIEAIFEDYQANARVDIHDKKNSNPSNPAGKFKDWDFDENIGAPYQHIFDSNPQSPTYGYILINPNHPVNKKYFGENPQKEDIEKLPQSQLYLGEVILNESLNIIVTEALKKGGLPRRLGDDYDVLFYIAEKKYQYGGAIYSLFSPSGEDVPGFEVRMQKRAQELIPEGIPEDISDREKLMIELRFGLNDQRPHTLDEIARKFSITRERVRQIIQHALGKKYKQEIQKEAEVLERDFIKEEEERINSLQEGILKVVSKYYGLTQKELQSKTRRADIVLARHVSMYLARKMIGLSFPSLGRIFSLDHTTVLHGCRKVEAKLKETQEFQRQIAAIEIKVRGLSKAST